MAVNTDNTNSIYYVVAFKVIELKIMCCSLDIGVSVIVGPLLNIDFLFINYLIKLNGFYNDYVRLNHVFNS